MKMVSKFVVSVIILFVYTSSCWALSENVIPDAGMPAPERTAVNWSGKILLAQNQNETAEDFLPMQDPSAGAARANKSRKANPVKKRMSLAEAQQNGIPTPIEFKPIVGRTVKEFIKRKEYQDRGVMNKPKNENKTYFRNEKIVLVSPDGSEYTREIFLEYPDNPSKSDDPSLYKWPLAKKNEGLRKRFPVPVLKPGVTWQSNGGSMFYKVPVHYRVVAIKSINGYDCVEIEGKGEVTEHLKHYWTPYQNQSLYSVRFCYDYNNQVDLYYKKHFRRLRGDMAEPLVYEDYYETRLESLTYE